MITIIGATIALFGVVYAPLMVLKLSVLGILTIGVIVAVRGIK